MEEKQKCIIIQLRPGSSNERFAKESTSSSEMLTTLTSLVRGGHAASEQLTNMPTKDSMPIICGSYSTFLWHCHTLSLVSRKQVDSKVAE